MRINSTDQLKTNILIISNRRINASSGSKKPCCDKSQNVSTIPRKMDLSNCKTLRGHQRHRISGGLLYFYDSFKCPNDQPLKNVMPSERQGQLSVFNSLLRLQQGKAVDFLG